MRQQMQLVDKLGARRCHLGPIVYIAELVLGSEVAMRQTAGKQATSARTYSNDPSMRFYYQLFERFEHLPDLTWG
jgi:hypothetical protein